MKNVLAIMFIAVFLSACASSGTRTELPPLTEQETKILKLMGGELLPNQNIKLGDIIIDRFEKEISFPAEVNMTSGPIECLICTKSGRAHESLLLSSIAPFKLQLALTLFGAENGARKEGVNIQQGTLLDIYVKTAEGEKVKIEKWLLNTKTNKELESSGWVFVGSSFASDGKCIADEEGNIINIWSYGNTILDNPSESGDNDDSFNVMSENVAPFHTPVTVYLKMNRTIASEKNK